MITVDTITSKQRSKMKAMAATISPIAQIGKGGVTDNLLKTLSDALEARELVKLKVLETCAFTVGEAALELAAATGAEVVATIGTKLILYRESATKKKIELC